MSIEWALVFFTLFAGLSAGTFVGVAWSEWSGKFGQVRRPGAWLALIALAVSGFSSVLHLGHPERVFGALAHPTSGIFLEALLMGLFGLMLIAYLVSLRREASDGTRKFIATIGLIPAALLAFAVGYTYVMPSRPAWDTLVLPLLYMASAAVMGVFMTGLLGARRTRAAIALLAVQAALTVGYLVHLAIAPHPDATRSLSRVLAGDLAFLFWIGLVVIGLLAPAALMFRARRAESLTGAGFALACVLVSGIAFRALMFLLGSGVRSFF